MAIRGESTHIKKMIKLLADVLEGQVLDGYEEIEIETETGRRKLSKIPTQEIFKLREQYLKKLKNLDGKNKKAFRILTKF